MFDVLSPDRRTEDRTVELAEYNAVPSTAHDVRVEQSTLLAHVHSRGPGDDFVLRPAEPRGLDGAIALPAVGIAITMAEGYEPPDLGAEPDADAPPPTKRPW